VVATPAPIPELDRAEPLTRADLTREDTWNLSTIFPDEAAWETAFGGIDGLLAAATAHRGKLGDGPTALAAAIGDVLALRLATERLAVYATLRHHEDMTEPAALARYERAAGLGVRVAEALAFFQPELLALPAAQFDALVADPELAPYRHLLDDLGRQRPHIRSLEVEEVLAQQADVARGPAEAFSALDNADIVYGEVRDDQGREVTLTKGRHALLLRSKDRDVRRATQEAFVAPYLAHDHTLAALYAASVRGDVFDARVRRHATAREDALFGNNVPVAVYDTLVGAVREAAPVVGRYYDLRRRVLGLDELKIYDLQVPLSPEPERRYPYREAVDIVLSGLDPLGERYVADLRAGFASRWVDVHETKGKRSGAYSSGAYGSPPVMLMNWNGTIGDVFTLAHEAGHAMHTFYADAALPYHDAGYPIFLAEIASTINETLLNWHLIAEAPADDALGRFELLNRFADTYLGTVVRQTMFAEFEQRAHAVVEARQPLTLENLSALYGELWETYNPGVAADEMVRINWGRIPHFYRAFYVFQYATGLSAAIALAAALRDEGAPAQERVLGLLASGGSDYPLNLLRRAGVDLETPGPILAGLAEFERVIAEMEAIEASGALAG
jgi:oligoendopeptidase F